MEKTKILFLSPLPPPFYGSAISSKMCLEILQEDISLNVDNIKLNYSGTIEGVGKFSCKKFFWSFIVMYKILKAITSKTYNIVYFVPATAGIAMYRDFIFLNILKISNKSELILHLRSRFLDKDFENAFKTLIIKKLLTCDRLILLGKELLPNINSLVEDHKIFYLHNAIPNLLTDEEFIHLRQTKDSSKPINILFLSNMAIEKGWFKLLETCVILKQEGLDFQCNFVGGWPSNDEEKLFFDFVGSNRLSDVAFYQGAKFGNDKDQYLRRADILVFPTEYKLETFGRVIVEAMEYGIPVIANGIATIPSIINHGETGFVLRKNTAEEIANFIVELKDENVRNYMGEKGRIRFLENFTRAQYASSFLEFFHNDK
jgi:glycosyltransferase involved in cell wall biosynthesis